MAGWVEYPHGIDDEIGILNYVENMVEAHKGWRFEMERNAMRNILYANGIQWITYDAGLQTWRPLGLRKTVPRPVTNKIQPLLVNTVSRLIQFRPPMTFRPGGMGADDMTAAGVAEDVLRIVEKETRIRRLKPIAARWLGTTGNVFLVNSYDASPDTGVEFIQHEVCEQGHVWSPDQIVENEGTCPHDGSRAFAPAVDEDDEAIGEWIPRGRHYTEVKPLFNCYFDPEVMSIDDSSFFMVSESMAEDWVVQTWGADAIEGVDRESGVGSDSISNYFLQSLAYTVTSTREVWGVQGFRPSDRIRVRRIWLKPRYDRAPEGIYATILGANKVIESKPWPYQDDEGRKFLNVVHMRFDHRDGSGVGRTRMDDLIPKQDERNLIESHFLLHTRRMSNALWLVPTGSGIQKLTGETGPVYQYQAQPGVAPPTRVSGVSPPQFLIQWMEQIDREMDAP